MEVCCILAIAVQDYIDFAIILAVIIINGVIGFREEMKAKRDSILKVTNDNPTKSPERKSVGKLSISAKKTKRKTGGFTDVIDELSYTLAKMRGEVVDGNDDDEEEDDPVPPTTKTVAFKLFTPLPPPPPSTSETPAPPTISSTKIGVPSVPKPKQVPCPPPLPDKSWPKPVPYIAPKQTGSPSRPKLVVDTNTSGKSTASNSTTIVAMGTVFNSETTTSKVVHSTKVVTRMLPSGYYMPTEVIGSIYPGSIVPSGKTTSDLILSLSQKFESTTRMSMAIENEDTKVLVFIT
jgi:hypothetical protein